MIRHLLRKDVLLLLRSIRASLSIVFFSLLLVVIASFAFRSPGLGQEELKILLPGVFWMVFLFVSVVTLHQSFAAEEENSAFVGLLLSGVRPELLFLSKFSVNWAFLLLLHGLVMFFSALFFAVSFWSAFPALCGLSLLVSCGVSCLGTLLSSISSAVRGRELLLPVLLFPLCLPVLLAAVSASQQVLAGVGLSQVGFPLVLLGVFDVIVFTVAMISFEYLVLE